VSFTLHVAKDISDPRDQGIRIALSGQHNRHELSASAEAPYRSASLRLSLKPYPGVSPLLPEHSRAPLEEAMAFKEAKLQDPISRTSGHLQASQSIRGNRRDSLGYFGSGS